MNSSEVSSHNYLDKNENDGKRKRIIVLIRHGIALHNVIDPRTGQPCNYCDPYFFDSPLILDDTTMDDMIQMGKNVKEWFKKQHHPNVELIITSPLTRCIQTALIAFGGNHHHHHSNNKSNDIFPQQQQIHQQQNRSQTLDNNHEIPIICKEVVREAYGKHYPDKRKEKSKLMVRCVKT
jgi:hypothetical protein